MHDGRQPKRHLRLEGTYNVRDIGGYRTTDGRHTRWRRLLRADSLHRLTPASQAALVDYGVRTVIDLRFAHELASEPNVFANSTAAAYHHMDMIGDALQAELDGLPPAAGHLERILRIYTMMIDHRQRRLCEILSMLATPGVLPALVHCRGGKDRTGVIAAFALGLVGVPAETIAEDYALSARFLLKRSLDEQAPDLEAHYTSEQEYQRDCCPPDVMLGTLRHLDECYGGPQAYLLEGGLSPEQIERLRNELVE
ncbi:MAG: tyrosine-protein phosphatase [Lentisphaeria bacterium]|jgi:protein-tyrosine phosphatase|nr:tyrosine-protein phosphatase [Lentisphaeria bacterium]MDP7742084.1 tyrosine-protein phosphatase [Lentisphaeria bacterium]